MGNTVPTAMSASSSYHRRQSTLTNSISEDDSTTLSSSPSPISHDSESHVSTIFRLRDKLIPRGLRKKNLDYEKTNRKRKWKPSANCTRQEFYQRLQTSPTGSELAVSSFGTWCRRMRIVGGFEDRADYASSRQPLLGHGGAMSRADTTEGRFFQCHFRSRHEINIHEKESPRPVSIQLPRVTSPQLTEYLRSHRRPGRRHRAVRSSRVVASQGNHLVLQVNSDQHRPFAKMYFIDIDAKMCQGHFIVCHSLRRWYEVYVSPNSSKLLLRPDVRYQFQATPGFVIQNETWYPPLDGVKVHAVPATLLHHKVAFNAKLGEDYVIAAATRRLTIFKLEDWSVEETHALLARHSIVRQIRSSSTGDYLAIRYTLSANGYNSNQIVVVHYPSLTKALEVDIRGAFWPVADIVNLQVFPRFSLSESCLAVIKQHNWHRKVYVYKLPALRVQPLKQLCRRALLQLVSLKDVTQLPLPKPMQQFLVQQ